MPAGRGLPAVTKNKNYPQPVKHLKPMALRQDLPAGWEWQWLVQEDGQTGEVAAMLPDDPRISAGSGRPGGDSTARNMCLSRAAGELIKVLDADDQLTPGILDREISVLSERPE